MKRKLSILLPLIGVISVLILVISACDNKIYNEWPTADVMKENLKKKDYTIIEDEKILIDDMEYTGTVIIATKKSELIAAFWTDNTDEAVLVNDYWAKKYQPDYILKVGTTIYCGTKKAIKHAGINLY